MINSKRPNELGLLIVVGGPGGSGSTTIAKMIANHFKLSYVYAGKLMRDIATKLGFDDLEQFIQNTDKDLLEKYDKEVDKKCVKYSYQPNIVIEGKVFAALCDKYRIPTTVRVWLDTDLDVRAKRKYGKEGGDLEKIKVDLSKRYEIDKERYNREYGIDYSSPKKYNDIVIDTSHLNEYQTFTLILKLIEDGRYIRK